MLPRSAMKIMCWVDGSDRPARGRAALEQGHGVTAIVRNPDKLKQTHDIPASFKASIFSAEELTAAFAGTTPWCRRSASHGPITR